MKPRATERVSLRAYPGANEKLWLFRDELAAARPGYVVTMADVIDFCVNSGSTLLNEGRSPETGIAPKDRDKRP